MKHKNKVFNTNEKAELDKKNRLNLFKHASSIKKVESIKVTALLKQVNYFLQRTYKSAIKMNQKIRYYHKKQTAISTINSCLKKVISPKIRTYK